MTVTHRSSAHRRARARSTRPVPLVPLLAHAGSPPARTDAPPSDPTAPTSAAAATRSELNLINLPTTTVAEAASELLPPDPSVRARPAARRLRLARQDFFSLDNGAVIGLEYRFGITSHAAGRRPPIDFEQDDPVLRPLRCAGARASRFRSASRCSARSKGSANFHQNYQPGVAVTVSRMQLAPGCASIRPRPSSRTHAPSTRWSATKGTTTICRTSADDDDTQSRRTRTFIGLGDARPHPADGLRRRRSTRRAWRATIPGAARGESPSRSRRAGHTLQLNFTNAFGTTLGQIARGGSPHDVYLGFNLVRRF